MKQNPKRKTNLLFSFLFVASLFFLMRRWHEKVRLSTPLYVVDLAEIISIVSLVGFLIYLISFFGIAFFHTIVDDDTNYFPTKSSSTIATPPPPPLVCPLLVDDGTKYFKKIISISSSISADDEEIVSSVVAGKTPSYSLDSRLGDYLRAVGVRCEGLKRITSRNIEGLPLYGFDYASIIGQCCEMPIGYVQIPSRSTGGPTTSPWPPRRGASLRAPTWGARLLRSREGR